MMAKRKQRSTKHLEPETSDFRNSRQSGDFGSPEPTVKRTSDYYVEILAKY